MAILRRYGVRNARVFGSVVREEDREESDLDLLVEFRADTTLVDVSALHLDLEEGLGSSVEIVSEGAVEGERGSGSDERRGRSSRTYGSSVQESVLIVLRNSIVKRAYMVV